MLSFNIALLATPYFGQDFLLDLKVQSGKLFETSVECPKEVGIAAGESFDFSGAQQALTSNTANKTKDITLVQENEKNNESDKKRKVEKPCLGRYANEPVLYYLYRRFYISYLEFKRVNIKKELSRPFIDVYYRGKLFITSSWKKDISVEDVIPKLYIYHTAKVDREYLKVIFEKAFVSTRYYQSNLSQKSLKFISVDNCKGVKILSQEIEEDLKTTCRNISINKKIDECLKSDDLLMSQECLSPASFVDDTKNNDIIACNRSQIRRNYKIVCFDQDTTLTKNINRDIIYLGNKLFNYKHNYTSGIERSLHDGNLKLLVDIINYDTFLDSNSTNFLNNYSLVNNLRTHLKNDIRSLNEKRY